MHQIIRNMVSNQQVKETLISVPKSYLTFITEIKKKNLKRVRSVFIASHLQTSRQPPSSAIENSQTNLYRGTRTLQPCIQSCTIPQLQLLPSAFQKYFSVQSRTSLCHSYFFVVTRTTRRGRYQTQHSLLQPHSSYVLLLYSFLLLRHSRYTDTTTPPVK